MLDLDKIVVAYVRDRVRRETSEYGGKKRLSRAANISDPHISNITNHDDRGIGEEVIGKLAKHWNMRRSALEDAAIAWDAARRKAPAHSVELVERYPSRELARKAAVLLRISPRAIAIVDAMRLDSEEDPGVDFWLDQYRAERDRERAGVVRTPDDTIASIEKTRPKLPK